MKAAIGLHHDRLQNIKFCDLTSVFANFSKIVLSIIEMGLKVRHVYFFCCYGNKI